MNGFKDMSNKLTDQDLALLHVKFVVPMAVGDILRGDEALDETSEYVLNTVLSDLQPDTALLCIALCAQRLSAHCDHLPVARMLRVEADRIVEDHGRIWLDHHTKRRTPDSDEVLHILKTLPEDLEAMAHLIDATLADMAQPKSAAGRLCDLLAIQAHEHIDLAEAHLQAFKAKPAPRIAMRPVAAETNIVPFPPARRPS